MKAIETHKLSHQWSFCLVPNITKYGIAFKGQPLSLILELPKLPRIKFVVLEKRPKVSTTKPIYRNLQKIWKRQILYLFIRKKIKQILKTIDGLASFLQ